MEAAPEKGRGRRDALGLPLLIGGVAFFLVPVQMIVLPSRVLALSCARAGAAPCGSAAAIEAAAPALEALKSFANIPALLTLPGLTALADRMGRKPMLVLCVVGMALDALGCALAPSLPALLVIHTATGAVGSLWLFLALSCAARADETGAARGERAAAFAAVESALMLAVLLGPFLVGSASARLGAFRVLLCAGGALSALALAAAVLLRETLPAHARAAARARADCARAASPLEPLRFLCGGGGARGKADAAAVRRVAALMALTWGAMRGTEYLLVPYASEQFGWADAALGRYSTATALATVAANLALAATPLSRLSAPALCALGAAASALGCALDAASSGGRAAPFWAGSALYSLATFLSPLLRAMLSAHVPPAAQARALGAAAALESATALLAPLAFGPLLHALAAVRLQPLAYALAAALFAAMLPIARAHGRALAAGEARARALAALPATLAEPLVTAAAEGDGDCERCWESDVGDDGTADDGAAAGSDGEPGGVGRPSVVEPAGR